jgi:hypothetical protein
MHKMLTHENKKACKMVDMHKVIMHDNKITHEIIYIGNDYLLA